MPLGRPKPGGRRLLAGPRAGPCHRRRPAAGPSLLSPAYVCGSATAVTAGTPVKTVVALPVAVAAWLNVSVLVPAPDTTVVPAGKSELTIPTLPPPTNPPALT